MSNGSMSEKIGPIGRSVLSRVLPVVPLVFIAFVALVVGFVASKTVRQPYETPYPHLFFSDTLHMKAWLLTAALVLSLGQLLTASRIYEVLRFPPKGRFYHVVHRWSGRIAILLTLPAAYDCIFLLGFETNDSRVYIHSLLGHFSMAPFSPRSSLSARTPSKAGRCRSRAVCCSRFSWDCGSLPHSGC